jgi:phosphatidylglycerol---prolipoprotein diacylglyceryl transferase
MYPILFELGPIPVYSYGLLLAVAYLLGLKLALVRARHAGIDPARVMDLGLYVIISALVGAKLLLVAVDFEYYRNNPGDVLTLARSGGVFYGGLLAAVVVGIVYLRRHRLPVWKTADVFAPSIALGHVVGRTGCLLAGCCYGRPTELPWGVVFTNPLAAANVGTPLGIPLHPAQMYDAGAELLILGALLTVERRGRAFAGRTFWLYILLYAISRFFVEVFRGDERGTVFGIVSTSQFVSLVLVPLSLGMLLWLSRRPEPAAPPAPAKGRRRAAGART